MLTGIIIIVAIVLAGYYLGVFNGAPFMPTKKSSVLEIIELSGIKPGDKLADIGSGDGRILIAAAKAGAEAHGYEINPLLVFLSRQKIKNAGFSNKAFVHWKNFWREDLKDFNIVTIFGVSNIMSSIGNKLKNDLRPGSKVICHVFPIPDWNGEYDKGNYKYII